MTHYSRLQLVLLRFAALLSVSLLASVACEPSEAPPDLPKAPASTAAPQPNLELAPEDAAVGEPAVTEKNPAGRRSPVASLMKCCAALRQNAESSPQKEPMLMAASACEAAVKSGSTSAVKAAVAPFVQRVPAGCL